MQQIAIIKDEDFGLDPTRSSTVKNEREAVRAVLLDDQGRIGLIEATLGGYYKLPGGGIDAGELREQALRRELIEEAGYEIEIIDKLGYTVEYRCQWPKHPESGLKQTSYCYVVRATRNIGAAPEVDEAADGFELVWLDIDEAISRFDTVVPHKSEGSEAYDMVFYTRREKLILEYYQKIRKS